MSDSSRNALSALEARLSPLGQTHVLDGWDELSAEQQRLLREALDQAPLERLVDVWRESRSGGAGASNDAFSALAARAEPPAAVRVDAQGKFDASPGFGEDQAEAAGLKELAEGRVGVVLVAGGQGTRLDFPQPKGMYPIGPVSQATLFQILCEKILAVGRRAGRAVPLYVMTSSATHDETVEFFDRNAGFGLAPGDLSFFQQGELPALDAETGRLLFSAPGRLSLGPDGHGGLLAALRRSGSFDDMARRGLTRLFYCQVDNPLVRMCDPLFLGCHILSGSQASTKVVRKRSPLDRVGNVVRVDGRTRIIEYSDLPSEAAHRLDSAGDLLLWAGNTAMHVFDTAFLAQHAPPHGELPLHRALKIMPYYDPAQGEVRPDRPNAVKFERFIFDLLPLADQALAVECVADDEFAGVKQKPGSGLESPEWVQDRMQSLHRRWLASCGVVWPETFPLEISPLWADSPEELKSRLYQGHCLR